MASDPHSGPTAFSIDRIFELEPHGSDVWVGDSPAYPWGRIFGGLVIAQAMLAATKTVAAEHIVHSLHGYFILGGDPREPVRYEVTRLRNGRSFTTRQVTARQSGGAIFTMSCSYQGGESGAETQTAIVPDGVPAPADCPSRDDGSGVRIAEASPTGEPVSRLWARMTVDLPDDPAVHACALAYMTDVNAMEAVAASHPEGPAGDDWNQRFMMASLDHAMWFHRPVRADDWVLMDVRGHGVTGTRGLATGNVFDASGTHLATVAQEGLIRQRRR